MKALLLGSYPLDYFIQNYSELQLIYVFRCFMVYYERCAIVLQHTVTTSVFQHGRLFFDFKKSTDLAKLLFGFFW